MQDGRAARARVLLLLLLLMAGGAQRIRVTPSQSFFPLEQVERLTSPPPGQEDATQLVEALRSMAGAYILHGKFVQAERAIATCLLLNPSDADALYLLGSMRCQASRLGEARDAFTKAYHCRAIHNSFEVAAVNNELCPLLPLLFPSNSVMHETAYPVFPHYAHSERHYALQHDEDHPAALQPSGETDEETMMEMLAQHAWNGMSIVKQTSGDAAWRESVVFRRLVEVERCRFAKHFPIVIRHEELERVSAGAGGVWSAYEVEQVFGQSSNSFLRAVVEAGDTASLTLFLHHCLNILEALQTANVIHHNLNAEVFIIRAETRAPVLVDAEIAAAPGLPAPSSASLSHSRFLHLHGRPSDCYTLGRSLERMLHRLNVTAYDCVLHMLLLSLDANVRYPHVSRVPHPTVPGALVPIVDVSSIRTVLDSLTPLISVGKEGMSVPKHKSCSLPPHAGWNPYQEELAADEDFRGEDPEGLGLERAGAPPFDRNAGMYELDSLLMNGSGLPAQRFGDFFYGMGSEVSSVQEDARGLYREAVAGRLAFKAVAQSNLFVSSNAICCWDEHERGSRYQREVIRNASLCWKGLARFCPWSRALVVPSIDALAQELDLEELLLLHRAWGDWFYSRITPVYWKVLSNVRALALPERRLILVYASSHTWMNHGSHATLKAMFPEHDEEKVEVVHLIMTGDQEVERAGDLPQRQKFINVAHISDTAAAELVNEMGAHILVDLNG
ncbi:hypothetical protein GUITHDRAFT_120038 [Guillardia theta CCMP2712]|uniref:Uncharacterized protein n=2 Tax=Guillardia theta TaxID=55529 RepID=L1ICI6_GUITC|nr:hypothetical protein GUITHDRAFT_120038 [Guillardia theta CCMP2712]EKX33772.1 hypothetical protein GUITHDRAFT_120038 [Guillardia theta CCMP2712]|eukprot:XP_005820752.1 hypothetical protein GUITHDRAFT_120038 [Guillardia theta CCMP2712]